jgi:hypothetical protein
MKCLEIARLQEPSPVDGVRKARIAAIRMNYRRMHDTLLPSWFKMFPEGVPGWTLNRPKEGPVDHTIKLNDPLLGPIELQMIFRAFGDQDIESFIRGFEVTAFWLNEADELPAHSLGMFYQRAGRYPGPEDRPDDRKPAWSGVFGDFNAPDEDSWVYEDLFLNPTDGTEVFIQPGGREPNAENVHNLEKIRENYYETMAAEMQEWEVARFIDNKIGMSRAGKPVFPEFRDSFHVSGVALRPEQGRPLRWGIDPGLATGAVLGQRDSNNCARIFRELVTPNGEAWDGAKTAEEVCKILMTPEFEAFITPDLLKFTPDPGYCNQRGKGDGIETWLQTFSAKVRELIGICPIYPAYSNFIAPRLGAVRSFLVSPDGRPRMLVDPSCLSLRRAMNGGYKMVKKAGANGEFKTEPEKNAASNVADGLQYFCVGEVGPMGLAMTPAVAAGRAQRTHHRQAAGALVGASL